MREHYSQTLFDTLVMNCDMFAMIAQVPNNFCDTSM